MSQRPHIVIFNPDSYRGDVLGHRGNPGAVTPNLDRMVAEDAVSFTEAFAQNPVCTPSRCSFMTGWYPHTHGHRSMKNMLKAHEPHLLKVLRSAGYHVWWGGKNDLVAVEKPEDYLQHCDVKFKPDQYRKGWQAPPKLADDDPRHGAFYGGVLTPDSEATYRDHDTPCVEGAIDVIAGWDAAQPLCLYLPLIAPHPMYQIERCFYDQIDPTRLPPRIPRPVAEDRQPPMLETLARRLGSDRVDEATWLEVRRIYYAMCTKIDDLFGQLVQALKEAGIYDNTLILFFSDHGDFAGDYGLPEKTDGNTLQDGQMRVPLIIKPPQGWPVQSGSCAQLVELVDLAPTLYDLLAIEPGYTPQGLSLRGLLAGESAALHDAVFAETGCRPDETAYYVDLDIAPLPPTSFYARKQQARPGAPIEGSYAAMCRTARYKLVRRAYNDWHELYDLQSDPDERHNRINDPLLADVQRQLEMHLLDHFMQTADVLPLEQDSRAI